MDQIVIMDKKLKNKIPMKNKYFLVLLVAIISSAPILLNAQHKDYEYAAVPFKQVVIKDNFWLPRLQLNHTITIPTSFERCENTGRVKNFDMAATKAGKFCTKYPFDDTDIYKTIEGASFSISIFPDKNIVRYMDSLITIISKAQEPDGYLYTARTIDPANAHVWAGKVRWEKEREMSHELYNAGHLYEAAVAHYQATGKTSLLNIAIKNANLVCSVFGEDKLHVAPGHEVIEMGLVKLYRVTGNQQYLKTAKYFIEERGHFKGYDTTSTDPWKNGAYWQDHIPVVEQREAIGHAVRAGYLYAAVADIAALTGDKMLLASIDSIWQNMVAKKIYVQGGAGAVGNGERYGDNYELPNESAYNETCAAIANVYWNQRMFQLHGASKYIDVLEKILYNGLISGLELDGKKFFYTNAMESKASSAHKDFEGERSGWFECSCCPTNMTRLLPSIPGYIYAQQEDKVYVNLFVNSSTSIMVNQKQIDITQENNYPWEGNLKFTVSPKKGTTPFLLKLRIPGWVREEAIPSDLYYYSKPSNSKVVIKLNGAAVDYKIENGYAVIANNWKKNDVVEMILPMEVRRVYANEKVTDDIGKVALQRGPLMYCAEWPDNNGKIDNIILPSNAVFSSTYNAHLLNGVTTLQSTVQKIEIKDNTINVVNAPFVAIPYYAWANRGKGEMTVWFKEQIKNIEIKTR